MENNDINEEWLTLFHTLSESQKRWSAAVKSLEIGYGGVSKVSHATGLSRTTITQDIKDGRRKVLKFLREGLPVISVNTKKELVGKFLNKGVEWRPKGNPTLVEDHNFRSRSDGNTIPYGTHDIGKNGGFANVIISKDTAEFATNSTSIWCKRLVAKIMQKHRKF
ncbi:MAG: hypothetical protein P8176_02165 [Gammaproteobacteria bacterium]